VLVLSPLMGMLAGFANGLGITKLRMPHPFIMTLGMLFMARAIRFGPRFSAALRSGARN